MLNKYIRQWTFLHVIKNGGVVKNTHKNPVNAALPFSLVSIIAKDYFTMMNIV
jgi:hypothetical protein